MHRAARKEVPDRDKRIGMLPVKNGQVHLPVRNIIVHPTKTIMLPNTQRGERKTMKPKQLTGKGRRPFTINLRDDRMKEFIEYCKNYGYLPARRLEVLMIKDMESESWNQNH